VERDLIDERLVLDGGLVAEDGAWLGVAFAGDGAAATLVVNVIFGAGDIDDFVLAVLFTLPEGEIIQARKSRTLPLRES